VHSHLSIGSRIPDDHLPPLGLLSIGGPLIDAGHDVQLLDADIEPLSVPRIIEEVEKIAPAWARDYKSMGRSRLAARRATDGFRQLAVGCAKMSADGA
jgi:hypothetical protein